jgi:hypothetical protein
MLSGGAESSIILWDLERVENTAREYVHRPIGVIRKYFLAHFSPLRESRPEAKRISPQVVLLSSVWHHPPIILPVRLARFPLLVLRPYAQGIRH